MKKILITILTLLTISCNETPKKKGDQTEKTSQKEWVTLFDGKSFDGWHQFNETKMSSAWYIVDDAMVFDPSKQMDKKQNNDLVTDMEYTNFELSLEWNIAEGGNSGIFWGVQEDGSISNPYLTAPEIQIIDNQQISKISPMVDSSIALKVDSTGIVSAHDLMTNFYHKSLNYEHDYLFKAEVMGIEKKSNNFSIELKNYFNEIEKVESKWVINAAGLNSDIIGNFFDIDIPKLRFLKGSYFKLSSKWKNRFDRLIYPLPDAEHGSLGIHLTIDADGMARLGPDAEWCQNREENYSVDESLINTFYEEGKKYLPDLEIDDLTPDYSGIRPKIYLEKDSMPDFYISHEIDRGLSGLINLIGIESPGLTGSLAIGEDIAKMVIEN